jgi:hypothetical protein
MTNATGHDRLFPYEADPYVDNFVSIPVNRYSVVQMEFIRDERNSFLNMIQDNGTKTGQLVSIKSQNALDELIVALTYYRDVVWPEAVEPKAKDKDKDVRGNV